MENNEVQVLEGAAEVATHSGLTRNQKVGIVAGATVLTAGAAYGIYRLVKFIKARKAAKLGEASEAEVHE